MSSLDIINDFFTDIAMRCTCLAVIVLILFGIEQMIGRCSSTSISSVLDYYRKKKVHRAFQILQRFFDYPSFSSSAWESQLKFPFWSELM